MKTYVFNWVGKGISQNKVLINHCKATAKGRQYFTMNSPIYNAIHRGEDFIDLGYGKHYFKITEI